MTERCLVLIHTIKLFHRFTQEKKRPFFHQHSLCLEYHNSQKCRKKKKFICSSQKHNSPFVTDPFQFQSIILLSSIIVLHNGVLFIVKQINHHPNILTLSCDFPEMSFNCIIYEQCLPFVLHYFLKYEYFHKNINFAFMISNILSKMFKMCSEKCQTTSKHHFVNLKCSQLFIFFTLFT